MLHKASGPAHLPARSGGAAQGAAGSAVPASLAEGGSHGWSREEAKQRHHIHSIRAGESRNPGSEDFRQTNAEPKALSFGFHSWGDTADSHGAVSPGNHRCCSPPQRQTRCPLCAAPPARPSNLLGAGRAFPRGCWSISCPGNSPNLPREAQRVRNWGFLTAPTPWHHRQLPGRTVAKLCWWCCREVGASALPQTPHSAPVGTWRRKCKWLRLLHRTIQGKAGT